jgi:hypothetical protein
VSRQIEAPHLRRRLALVILFMSLAACGGGGSSGSEGVASLEWQAPTRRVNGQALSLSELRGYYVYAGRSPGDMRRVVEISDAYRTTYEIRGIESGTYYFCVTAIDVSGLESPRSEIKSKTF